jgi:hypothetical protein
MSSVLHAVSAGSGQILRAATRLVATRRATKPLHPRGVLTTGILHRFGCEERTEAAWLDHVGEDRVLVRVSRALGLPSGIPDIYGLALRAPAASGHGDLLFASTGRGRVTRFILMFARSPAARPMTTLLPYRTPTGAVLISAAFQGDNRVTLAWSLRTGPWHRFAELTLTEEPVVHGDVEISFDPIRNVLPGLENYSWVQLLREPSYATARRTRS